MNGDPLPTLLDALVNGSISREDHEQLQGLLKSSPQARSKLRERIDLEAGLRSWAMEQSEASPAPSGWYLRGDRGRRLGIGLAIAVALLAMFTSFFFNDSQDREVARDTPAAELIGTIQEQDCTWDVRPVSSGGRFPPGKLSLASGVAKLSFDSGTDVLLEAPCELDVSGADSARLLAGTVFVNVTEISNGFTLETPEAKIIDEGTQYAVALQSDTTEVHVFDGSVFWIVDSGEVDFEDRIESGQARSYSRSNPTQRGFVPFGQRQFVRRLEQKIKTAAGDGLLAYDGFENIAGRVRRGRSGFGWVGGWQPAGRGWGRAAAVMEAPSDVVFGMNRSGRRLLALAPGDDVRRELENPHDPGLHGTLYASCLVQRLPTTDRDTSLQLSLEPDLAGRGRTRNAVQFGVTTEGFPFINCGNVIAKTAVQIANRGASLLVIKLPANDQPPAMRVYLPGESLDDTEPTAWTVTGERTARELTIASFRITSGAGATWHVDELRLGTSWQAVTKLGSQE